jgi:hypothetical protein
MAHFAKLDSDNKVIHVSVVDNWNTVDGSGNESEEVGIAYLKSIHGADTNWKQTSYNGNIRKNYAGFGMSYDAGRDAFIAAKPFASWVLNETTCRYEAPVAKPQDGKYYVWNESITSWDVVAELS